MQLYRLQKATSKKKLLLFLFENSLANAIIDRFGKKTMLMPYDEEHFEVKVEVAVSKQFYAWVLALGSGAKIVGPDEVVDELKAFLKELNEQYL